MNPLLKTLPVNELKNTSNILKICKENDEPILITRNGYGEAVIMSVEVYKALYEQIRTAVLIDESIEDMEKGGKTITGEEFFKEMMRKYGK